MQNEKKTSLFSKQSKRAIVVIVHSFRSKKKTSFYQKKTKHGTLDENTNVTQQIIPFVNFVLLSVRETNNCKTNKL